MDVGAYSSQNLISPYLSGAQSQSSEQQTGLRAGQKDAARGVSKQKGGGDQVKISPEAVKQANTAELTGAYDPARVNSANPVDETEDAAASSAEGEQIRELQATDREVRSHEAAHKAAAGRYGGAVSLDYQTGPDGERYAVGGEVGIDISGESTSAATIAKMQQVRAAAMAPANPSAQDRAVAAAADAKSTQAARELQSEKAAGSKDGAETASPDGTGKNNRIEDYQKSSGTIGFPARTGKDSTTTGFQDTGLQKPDTRISTYA